MNINMSLKCDECQSQTNCRVGLSNRDVQPLKFSCRICGNIIGIRLVAKNANNLDNIALQEILKNDGSSPLNLNPGVKYSITNATDLHLGEMFDPQKDFVDLHLDFPVVFGRYVPGNTPFMQALRRAGGPMMFFHRERLEIINKQYKKYPQVSDLISKYSKGFYGPFINYAKKHFKLEVKSKKNTRP